MNALFLGVGLTAGGRHDETNEQWDLATSKTLQVWTNLGGLRRFMKKEFKWMGQSF